MARDLPVNNRLIVQMSKSTVKNLVDGIVELITNSDDSYRRLEEIGEKVSGQIEIFVNRKKGGICEKLVVKDFAQGMSKEELEKAIEFAGETSGFNLGKSVRGLFGRGLKETIISLGEGQIKTVNNGKVSKTSMWVDKKSKNAKYDDELLNNILDTDEQNGTEITINITNDKIKIPEYENFKDQLTKHLALRDISNNKQRTVRLLFEDIKRKSKNESIIKFSYPSGEKIKDQEIRLRGFRDKIKLRIFESSVPLDFQRNIPFGFAGILIKTNGAILDNQYNQSKFSNELSALYFFGEAICEGLAERLRNGETEIIDTNRGGLEWRHEYCQSLSEAIDNVLEPIIITKRKTLEKAPKKEVKETTNKMLRRLCNLLNELAKKELDDTETIIPPPPDIKDLTIIPCIANIQIEKPRILSIYAPLI